MDTKDVIMAWLLNLSVFVVFIESNYSTKVNISITRNPAGKTENKWTDIDSGNHWKKIVRTKALFPVL